jgi:4-carboxymuconolactone decarboxylase
MPKLSEKSELGLKVITEMMGQKFGEEYRKNVEAGGFGATLGIFGLEHSFADVWARPGMERKHRSLTLIGALIALRQPSELRNHIRIGLNNGLTMKDIEEALISLSPYVGLPAVSTALTVGIEVFRERGLSPEVKTAEERGLL